MNKFFATLYTIEHTCYFLSGRQTALALSNCYKFENNKSYSKMASENCVYVTRPDVASIGLDLLKKE